MSTPNHITHLVRIDHLCKDWCSKHSRSCAYFSSLLNILTQRKDTSNFLFSSNNDNPSKNFSCTNLIPFSSHKNLPFALQSQPLTLLIYKQSHEIEEILTTIHSILDEFEEIINLMKGILNQSNKLVNPSQKSKQSPKKPKSTPPKKQIINLFDNFENPGDIADIPIITSNYYIVRIVEMYEKELCYKKNLIFGGCFKIDHNDEGINNVKLISERWAVQPYLLFEVEEEIFDRIKIWKRVKEFEALK
ncbi:15363_t:CDS:2 [Funneliformis geosporum]|uniref:14493_t:CDS:1 n=1 Tax=Funneliformis geosporum TaxID=1117311 RepID=A0A9W4SDE6_9GLOM|nr:14493_t:CDS:2 [Funneliformis geosporum]CAI2164070.1 15363_t:CDS:2 [Funneliformis geosporum]